MVVRRHWRPVLGAAACLLSVRTGDGVYDPVHHVESARIYGNIDAFAYYFVDLLIGNPPQRVSVIVDTGSGVTAFPCRSCKHCGRHIDPNFDFPRSTTAKWTPCIDQCHGSCMGGHCSYTQGYTEGSSISGWYFTDDVRMGDALQRNPPVRVSMGCHQDENHLFYTQKANGIMGIRPPGHGAPTIFDSLFADKAHIDSRVFGMCLADWGGRLVVGGFNTSYHTGRVQYVHLDLHSGYYQVPLSKMVLAGRTLHTSYGTAMIDSGTTYTYMGSEPYRALRSAIESYCRSHSSCGAQQSGTCWDANKGVSNFPTVEVWFGDVKTLWVPQAYMYRKGSGSRHCYGFEDDGPRANTVLGASWMMWQEIIFDLRVNKVGIVQALCPTYNTRPDFTGKEDVSVPVASAGTEPAKPLPLPDSTMADPAAATGKHARAYIFAGLAIAVIAVFGLCLAWRNADEPSGKVPKEIDLPKKPRADVVGVRVLGEQGEVRSDEEDPLVYSNGAE